LGDGVQEEVLLEEIVRRVGEACRELLGLGDDFVEFLAESIESAVEAWVEYTVESVRLMERAGAWNVVDELYENLWYALAMNLAGVYGPASTHLATVLAAPPVLARIGLASCGGEEARLPGGLEARLRLALFRAQALLFARLFRELPPRVSRVA